METYQNLLFFAAGFTIIALASKQIGQYFAKINLPLISGFLFAGIIAGPFVLDLIPAEAVDQLRFVDEVSLAFIAFAAGSELYLKELHSRLKSIAWVTVGNVLVIPATGALALFWLADFVPFMQDLSTSNRFAVALLGGAILVARSRSSCGPVVISPNTSSSATMPPRMAASASWNCERVHRLRSSAGMKRVKPPVIPRETIVILYTGSALGRM